MNCIWTDPLLKNIANAWLSQWSSLLREMPLPTFVTVTYVSINRVVAKLVSLWEHAWSSGKAQDSWSLDHQCFEFEPHNGQRVCDSGQDTKPQFASLTRAHLGPVACGEYYSLSADRACTWPVAIRPRWSKMIVSTSWWGNNIGNSALYPWG